MTGERTTRQVAGRAAEDAAAAYLRSAGWTILARNVRVGRDEVDLLAVDPGPPAAVACVEVRSVRVRRFGAPEERVDARKVGHLYRAMAALRAHPPTHAVRFARLAWRVDLVVVDRRAGSEELRHLRAVEPPG